jgi:hypothetical protein
MKKSYGEVILKGGSILYHTSDEPFELKGSTIKPMLFLTFHPSEWDVTSKLKIYIFLLFFIVFYIFL